MRNALYSALIIMFLSIAYFFVIYLPQKDIKRQSSIEECLQNIHADYMADWNLACSQLGKEDGCQITRNIAEHLEELMQKRNEECYKRFK